MSSTRNNISKNSTSYPQHIGIIMDGNGRWAKKKALERSSGHLNGIDAVKKSLRVSLEYKIPFVSLYVFSTENWKRPAPEVTFIFETIAGNLKEHYPFYREHGIKVVHSGSKKKLNKKILNELTYVEHETSHNNNLTLNLAFNYGGRDEIIRAVHSYYTHSSDHHNSPITEKQLRNYLDHPEIPDVDLVIRTGGEQRISNFLLWQIAYAELYFSDVLWPDWNEQNMHNAIQFYMQKNRRFGGLNN